jgi:hypothetical protein
MRKNREFKGSGPIFLVFVMKLGPDYCFINLQSCNFIVDSIPLKEKQNYDQ